MSEQSTKKAKLFMNGGSQAVRLPRFARFPEGNTDVLVRKEGNRVILQLPDMWSTSFHELLGSWTEEIERPPVTSIHELDDPFTT